MTRKFLAGAAAVAIVGASLWYFLRRDDPSLTSALDNVTSDYRRIIVLMDGNESQDGAARADCRGLIP